MIGSLGLLAVAISVQVPPPHAAAAQSALLHETQRAILDRETGRLKALAERLQAQGDRKGAEEVRRLLSPSPAPGGAEHFVSLAEVVPARGRSVGLSVVAVASRAEPAWCAELTTIRAESAAELFALAQRAGTGMPLHNALADKCLRGVIERLPDDPEARRLLGFVPFEGGWATPYAVQQRREDKVFHATFGWVPRSWVPHLEEGKLPARGRRDVFLPAAEADAQRSRFDHGWTIRTEHFQIKTNVPLAAAIAFGRHLETLHEVFESLLGDVVGENLPLVRRFKDPKLVGEKPIDPHLVLYFAEKSEFVAHLEPIEGPDIARSLGLYLPVRTARSRRGQAYFFRDRGGEIADAATLYHEASHQLLFESGIAGANDFRKNAGNYWVFEGLGTYFETLTVAADGDVTIGGLVGPRNEAARVTFSPPGALLPLGLFVGMDQDTFHAKNGGDIHQNYQEAIALTTFLLHGRQGAYRDRFLDYVKDACRGRIQRTGRSLEDRLGTSYAKLESEFLAYLRSGGE